MSAETGPIEDQRMEHALRLAEALVFASADPVPASRLAELLGADDPDATHVLEVLAARAERRGVHLVEIAGGWMFRTAPDLAPLLARVVEKPRRLPRAVMETLAIIAYHQPCTRAEIEERRGVALAQNTLETLLEAGLVRPAGRREVPGRPTLWATTPEFLARFGLASLGELPRRDDLLVEMPAVPARPDDRAEEVSLEASRSALGSARQEPQQRVREGRGGGESEAVAEGAPVG